MSKPLKCVDSDDYNLCKIMGFPCPHGDSVGGFGGIECKQYKPPIAVPRETYDALMLDWKTIYEAYNFLKGVIERNNSAGHGYYSLDRIYHIIREMEGINLDGIKQMRKKYLEL